LRSRCDLYLPSQKWPQQRERIRRWPKWADRHNWSSVATGFGCMDSRSPANASKRSWPVSQFKGRIEAPPRSSKPVTLPLDQLWIQGIAQRNAWWADWENSSCVPVRWSAPCWRYQPGPVSWNRFEWAECWVDERVGDVAQRHRSVTDSQKKRYELTRSWLQVVTNASEQIIIAHIVL